MPDSLTELGWNEEFARHLAALGDPELTPARVVNVQKTTFRVRTVEGDVPAVPTGLLLHPDLPRTDYPAIGDWVAVRRVENDEKVVVTDVLPRRTRFSRAVSTRHPEEQVIATNIDYVFIVTALNEDFSAERVQRYVQAVNSSGARPVVILNKTDLHEDLEAFVREVEAVAPGVPVHTVSALTDAGLAELGAYFTTGVTVALIGSSGVGKSTLTNRLLGREAAVTGDIREQDGRGRHTTTTRDLYVLPGGGVLIDNPGLREIAPWVEEVPETFEDIEELAVQCRYRGCTHTQEPGCAVHAAVNAGALDARRFERYQQSLQEEEAATVGRRGAPEGRKVSRAGKGSGGGKKKGKGR